MKFFKTYIILILIIIVFCNSSLASHEVRFTTILPNNMKIMSPNKDYINTNEMNSGYVCITFVDQKMNKKIFSWIRNFSDQYKNIRFFFISKDVMSNYGAMPVFLDKDGCLTNLFQITNYPTTIIFKDGTMIAYKENVVNKEEIEEILLDIENGKWGTHLPIPLLSNTSFIPLEYIIEDKEKNEFEYPSIAIFIDEDTEYNGLLTDLVGMKNEYLLPTIYLIVSEGDISKLTEITKHDFFKFIQIDDTQKETLVSLYKVDFTELPITLYIDENKIIKWAQFGYNNETFRKSLWTILK